MYRYTIDSVNFQVGQIVYVNPSEPLKNDESLSPSMHTPTSLWRIGRLGGLARVIMWASCGGKGYIYTYIYMYIYVYVNEYVYIYMYRGRLNWHGDRILERVQCNVQEEDASILLLPEDGSTGLDLSFATHLFLLEKIKDPAMENQIISRAHRMGATGMNTCK
jgi:hypothetical protein